MTSVPIAGVYNDGYIAELFDTYRRDPNAVGESWRQYFRLVESLAGIAAGPSLATTVQAGPAYLRKVAGRPRLTAERSVAVHHKGGNP